MKRPIVNHTSGTQEAHDCDCITVRSDTPSVPCNVDEASIAGRPPDEVFLLLGPGADPLFRTHVSGSVAQALAVGNRTIGSTP